jgi:pyruvate formate lyase activating enzyme
MKSGIIFSIEEFAIHDGPGIRTTIFLKGCPLACVWCHNPEGISPKTQWMYKKTGATLCGVKMTTQELSERILRNKEIYIHTKGGITLTGGEPLMQSDFVMELLQMLPEIHKTIETSGYASEEVFKQVVSLTDMILFDVKQMDSVMHKKFTGRSNDLILQNLKYLCESSKEFIVRIPLIPGVNDTSENMERIAQFIKDAAGLIRVELLRYHKTAGAKYKMIGLEYNPPFDVTKIPYTDTTIFERYSIETLIA